MRVLILSAFFACAAAAPSGLIAPLVYQPVAVPAIVPTISPGDIQAAAIDAQVKINDLARAAADKAQLIIDEAASKTTVEAQPDADLANEKNVEAFWSIEDKKWQALDALKTAEAQIDGAVASNADIYAKSAIGGVVPYVAHVAPYVSAPIPASFSAVYNPYIAAVKSLATQTTEVKVEDNKADKQEAAARITEPQEAAADESTEKVEAVTEKSADKRLVFANTIVTPYSSVYRYDGPAVGSLVAQPVFNYASIQPVGSVLAPAYLKSVW